MNGKSWNNWKPLCLKDRMYFFRHSKKFTYTISFLIILNSVILGVEASHHAIEQDDIAYKLFSYFDKFIIIIFTIEIIIKMYSERYVRNFFKDPWNVFDLAIISLSLIPFSAVESLLVLRILRIARVLRLVTVSYKIKNLVSILWAALPSIANIALLLFLITYVYAVLGRSFFSAAPSGMWDSVPIALLTLFQVLTFESWASDVMYEAMDISRYAWIYFVSYILISAFVVLNLFVAVIIDEITKIRELDIGNFGANEDRHNLEAIKNDIEKISRSLEDLKAKYESNKNEKT